MLRTVSMTIVAALALLIGGCQPPPEAPEQLSGELQAALEQRVRARWQARIAHDWGSAWEYTSPAYRAVFPKHLYTKKFSYTADWELTGVEVTNYDPAAAVASVVVGVMSRPTKQTTVATDVFGVMSRSLSEKWVLVDGQWWYSVEF